MGYNYQMEPPRPSILRTGGDADLAFAVVVLASYFATFSALQLASITTIVLLILLGMAYLAIGIYGYAYCAQNKGFIIQLGYFAIQIPLGGIIVYLGSGAGFNAMVLLPLAGHAVVLLSRRVGYITQLLIALAYVVAVYLYSGRLQVVWQGLPTFVAGLVFIVIFTQMTLNEETSRREVERLLSELTVANQKLRQYAIEVEDLATIKERNRLAREIHDGLGHYLTTIHMQIQAASAINAKDPNRATEMLNKAQVLTQEALTDVRHSVFALRSTPEDQGSLTEQIKLLLEGARPFEISTCLDVLGEERALDIPSYWALYRAAQEGISNTCKHAQASHLWLALDFREDKWVKLEVKDDGIGGESITEGFGLMGLKERANHLGGTVTLSTNNGQGFAFEVKIPG